mgnify:CR=1 FL=1
MNDPLNDVCLAACTSLCTEEFVNVVLHLYSQYNISFIGYNIVNVNKK